MSEEAQKRQNRRRMITGEVLSDKMDKTIVVQASTRVRHPIYGKVMTRYTKVKAHDPENKAKKGDVVTVQESRRLSRDKRWVLATIDEVRRQENNQEETSQ